MQGREPFSQHRCVWPLCLSDLEGPAWALRGIPWDTGVTVWFWFCSSTAPKGKLGLGEGEGRPQSHTADPRSLNCLGALGRAGCAPTWRPWVGRCWGREGASVWEAGRGRTGHRRGGSGRDPGSSAEREERTGGSDRRGRRPPRAPANLSLMEPGLRGEVHVCTHTCTCTHIRAHTHTRIGTRVHTCMHMCTYTHTGTP